MSPSSYWQTTFVLFILISLSFFFSIAEAAFIAAPEEKIFQLYKDGLKSAKKMLKIIEQKERAIGVILFCDNVLNILASSVSTILFASIFKDDKSLGIIVSTICMTFCIFIFGEVIPKTLGMRKSISVSVALAPFFLHIIHLFKPMVFIIEYFCKKVTNLFNFNTDLEQINAEKSILGAVEMYHDKGHLQKNEKQMLDSILNLTSVDMKDIMIHRSEVLAIDIDDEIDVIKKNIYNIQFTKVPIYQSNYDKLIGVLFVSDFFKLIYNQESITKDDIRRILKKPVFIPGDASIKSQLSIFKKNGNTMSFIVDEYGGLMGIVTFEDIMEHIIGDVSSDDLSPSSDIIKTDDNIYTVNADISLIDLNNELEVNFRNDEISSLGGLLITEIERIPSIGEVFTINDHEITILDATELRIIKVQIVKNKNTL